MSARSPEETDSLHRAAPVQGADAPQGSRIYCNQVLLAFAASLGYLAVGLVRGFSSSAVPSMRDNDNYLLETPEAESWISAVAPLGAAVGSLCSWPLLQWVGRRRTLLTSAPAFLVGWALIATAGKLRTVLVARMLTGFCAGVAIPSAQIYVSECSDAGVRGVLGSLPALLMCTGILASYILGSWLPWQLLAWASAAVPALMFIALLPLPESPVWLAARGRHEDADVAVAWLHARRSPPKILLDADKPPNSCAPGATPSGEGLCRCAVLYPLFLSLALLGFQQLSGIDAVVFYTVSIFHSARSSLDDHLATIVLGGVQLAANASSLVFIDRVGRRPLLITSGLIMSASMATLGTYFQLYYDGQASNLGLLPLISLIVFMIGFSIGYCSIPFLLMGEILPSKQRSLFSSIAGSFNLGFMFFVIKTFPDLKYAVGSQGAFWLYSAVCLLSCVFVWFLVPETKGKTLEEIENYFERKHVSEKESRDEY